MFSTIKFNLTKDLTSSFFNNILSNPNVQMGHSYYLFVLPWSLILSYGITVSYLVSFTRSSFFLQNVSTLPSSPYFLYREISRLCLKRFIAKYFLIIFNSHSRRCIIQQVYTGWNTRRWLYFPNFLTRIIQGGW